MEELKYINCRFAYVLQGKEDGFHLSHAPTASPSCLRSSWYSVVWVNEEMNYELIYSHSHPLDVFLQAGTFSGKLFALRNNQHRLLRNGVVYVLHMTEVTQLIAFLSSAFHWSFGVKQCPSVSSNLYWSQGLVFLIQ